MAESFREAMQAWDLASKAEQECQGFNSMDRTRTIAKLGEVTMDAGPEKAGETMVRQTAPAIIAASVG